MKQGRASQAQSDEQQVLAKENQTRHVFLRILCQTSWEQEGLAAAIQDVSAWKVRRQHISQAASWLASPIGWCHHSFCTCFQQPSGTHTCLS